MKANYSHAADPPAPCRSPRALAFLMAALLTLSVFASNAAPQVPPEGKYPFVDKIPQAIFRVTPDYPPQAYRARIEGTVVIQALIDAAGRPESLVVAKSIPELDGAALAAIRQWRFSPAMREGTPVPVWVSIPVPFSISSTDSLDEPTAAEAARAMTMTSLPGAHDCDCNGVPDSLDVLAGRAPDVNHNSQDDVCDDDPAVRRAAWSEGWRKIATLRDSAVLLVRHECDHRIWIRYTVPRGGARVWLTVRAPSGAIVRTLVRSHVASGAYEYLWDESDDRGASVADGVTYSISLEIGSRHYVRPVFWRRMP